MKTQAYLVIILTCLGCGSKNSSSDSTQTQLAPTTQTVTESGAELIAAVSDLGTCDSTKFGELFYVQDASSFYFCSKTNSKWTAIDLQGPKGDTGASGNAGATGAQGAQGTAGQNGTNGTNGKDAPIVDTNEWVDPITGLKWIAGEYLHPALLATDPCVESPTQAEAYSAVASGMLIKFSSFFTHTAADGAFIVGVGDSSVTMMCTDSGCTVGLFTSYPTGQNFPYKNQYYVLCVTH